MGLTLRGRGGGLCWMWKGVNIRVWSSRYPIIKNEYGI